MALLSYRRHRFPPTLIQHAIWLYLRFTLSYRDVEEVLTERGLDDPERHHLLGRSYGGHDPGACAGYVGAQASWLLGYPEDALTLARHGLTLAERTSDPFSVVTASLYVAMVHLNRGEPELALQRLATAELLAAEQRVGLVVVPEILRGTALTALGAFDEDCGRDAHYWAPPAQNRTCGIVG
jgi:hypothetical protein